MASSNNNTNSLSEGPISGRSFADYTARQMSLEVARHNYGMVSDAKMEEFRKIVFKMVSTWAPEDKVRLLSEYGDMSRLPKNPRESDINKQLTETLIVHLNPSDLQQLVDDTITQENNLRKDIKQGIAKRKKENEKLKKSFFNTNTFEDIAKKTNNAKSQKEYKKIFKSIVAGYKIPKALNSQYSKLRKELLDVLKNSFNKVELAAMASEMGLEVTGSQKELYDLIINKTVLYVDLIVGRSKKHNLGGTILDPTPYNNLLQYTSYSYVTGNPGLDPREWFALKQRARLAKKQIQERMKMQNNRASTVGRKFKEVAGIRGVGRQLKRSIARNDQGILKDKTLDELLELCGIYGVDPTKKNEATIKIELYQAIASENKRVRKLENKDKKQEGGNVLSRRGTQDILKIHSTARSILNPPSSAMDSSFGSSVPLITFNARGLINEAAILKAVPVYIVGQGGAGIVDPSKTTYTTSLKALRADNITTRQSGDKLHIKSIDDIPPNEWNFFEYVRNLPWSNSSGEKSRLPLSLDDMRDRFLKKWVKSSVLEDIERTTPPDGDGDNKDKRARYYVWLYAKQNRMEKLASYLTNKYGIMIKGWKSRGKQIGRVAGKVGLTVLSILGVGLVGLAAIKAAKNREYKKNRAHTFEELTLRDQQFYDEYKNLSVEELKMACGNKKFSTSKIEEIMSNAVFKRTEDGKFDAAKFKKFLIMFLAKASGRKELYEYLFYTLTEKENVDKNLIEEVNATQRGIAKNGGIGGVLGRIFNRRKKRGTTEYSTRIFGDAKFDTDTNEGQRLPIPKVLLKEDGTIDGPVREVVPVYIMGLTSSSEKAMIVNHGEIVNAQGSIGYKSQGEVKAEFSGGKNIVAANNHVSDNSNLSAGGNAGNTDSGIHAGGDVNLSSKDSSKMSIMQKLKQKIFGVKPAPETETPKASSVLAAAPKRTSGTNKMVLPMSAQSIVSKMKELNHTPSSKALKNPTAQAGEEIVLTNSDKAWIKKNIDGAEETQATAVTTSESKSSKKKSKKSSSESSSKTSATLAGFVYKEINNPNVSIDATSIGLNSVLKGPAIPVYMTNPEQEDKTYNWLEQYMHQYFMLLGMPKVIAAPFGVGSSANPTLAAMAAVNMGMSIAGGAMRGAMNSVRAQTGVGAKAWTGATITKAATGADITRFNTGGFANGTTAITGDAPGSNIFANGAKPELVQSDGNLKVTPLNTGGQAHKQKVSRMSSTDRQNAMATSIASHVVKFQNKLGTGVEELSNVGEALKVYSVKPGIMDDVEIGGTTTNLMTLLANIYAQVSSIAQASNIEVGLLGTISTNTAKAAAGVPVGSNDVGNPFAGGFPDSLDAITNGH